MKTLQIIKCLVALIYFNTLNRAFATPKAHFVGNGMASTQIIIVRTNLFPLVDIG